VVNINKTTEICGTVDSNILVSSKLRFFAMWFQVVVFIVLVVAMLVNLMNKYINNENEKCVNEKEGFTNVEPAGEGGKGGGSDTAGWSQVSEKVRGVRNECLIKEQDANMRRLHRNMWMRGGTRIDDVASVQSRIIGMDINKDTDKAQRRIMAAAKKWALEK
jgi:hypothetical protein